MKAYHSQAVQPPKALCSLRPYNFYGQQEACNISQGKAWNVWKLSVRTKNLCTGFLSCKSNIGCKIYSYPCNESHVCWPQLQHIYCLCQVHVVMHLTQACSQCLVSTRHWLSVGWKVWNMPWRRLWHIGWPWSSTPSSFPGRQLLGKEDQRLEAHSPWLCSTSTLPRAASTRVWAYI